MQHRIILNDPNPGDYFYKEALKTLRANLQFSGKSNKVVLLTSCYSNEGKSDITFHLAVELANAGKRVLLIDADIRKSVYINRYNIEEKTSGLSQYLSGQIENVNDIIYNTNYLYLQMILAGPAAPNPSEILGDASFGNLLAQARKVYDYVLVDTPPLGEIIDAAVIGQYCDGAIIVLESGASSYRVAQGVKQQLENSGCKVLGAVLNKVAKNTSKYGYHKYGKYYGYGYGENAAEHTTNEGKDKQ